MLDFGFYNMDCMEGMKQFPDNYFDLAIVDPPYGINLKGENLIRNKSDRLEAFNTNWDCSRPTEDFFVELRRVSKEQIIWGGNYFFDYLGICYGPIIWDKLNGGSIYADGELAWTSGGLKRNLKIWRHQWCGAFKDSERDIYKIHPTQKPVALYKWILSNYAKPGDKILDTHVGSASSLIACYDLGFDYVGFEIDEEYYKLAKKRLDEEMAQVRFDL